MGLNVARFRFVEGTQFLCWNGQGASHHALKGFATGILVGPGKGTTHAQALRLAYPDIDSRVVRLLRADGFTILDHGKTKQLTFAAIVNREAAGLRETLDAVAKAAAKSGFADKDRRSFDGLITKERKAIDKVVAEAAKGGAVTYVSCRKAIEQFKPIAERVGQLEWQMKALVLANRAMQP